MEISLLLYPLIFLMIIGALIAVETSNLLSSIISLGAVGFLLSIAFLLMGAPEIAITQIVVEIIVLVVLIRTTINRDLTAVSGDREFFGLVFTLALLFALAMVGLRVFSQYPHIGVSAVDRITDMPSQAYLREAGSQSGSANVVEAILLHFRGLDAVAAVTALFTAVLGGLALLRQKSRKQISEPDEVAETYEYTTAPSGMSLIVKTATRWVKGFILLFGIYLVLNGHHSPGGGFAGGVIFACALILVVLAMGKAQGQIVSRRTAGLLSALGALLFLGVSGTYAGRVLNRGFAWLNQLAPGLFNFSIIQVSETGIGLMVGFSLYLVFLSLASLHVRVRNGEREIVRRRKQ